MKLTNFKTIALMLSASALLALSGCGSTGESSDSGFGDTTVTPPDTNTTPPIEGNLPPVADAGPDQTVAYGQDVTLVGDASSDPDGTIVSYEWKDSSDAVVGNQATTVLSGLIEGVHLFTLTVTDDDGDIDTDTVSIDVSVAECLNQADNGYGTVDVNGRTWLDRNLGATAVANATFDNPESFGHLYQWGRAAEGHELRTSETTTSKGSTGGNHATTIDPNTGGDWDGLFITEGQNNNGNLDWVKDNVDQNGSERAALWGSPSSDSNLNQVCPCGYIVPSDTEFTDLNTTELATLKLTISGYRSTDGTIETGPGTGQGSYWTRVDEHSISFDPDSMLDKIFRTTPNPRSEGQAIRCIKPQ